MFFTRRIKQCTVDAYTTTGDIDARPQAGRRYFTQNRYSKDDEPAQQLEAILTELNYAPKSLQCNEYMVHQQEHQQPLSNQSSQGRYS